VHKHKITLYTTIIFIHDNKTAEKEQHLHLPK